MTATMYHVTPRSCADSILTQGLRTDGAGWDARYVWFFDDLDLALTSARVTGTWGGVRGPHAVIAVDVTGLPVIPDPHPGWGDDRDDHAYALAGHVPADRLSRVE